ncbi:MAG: hypothetical protein IPL46_06390 [Saprospiraceae bacterium]|nr:hypothetical protein [Saprospiraceae bacterium]
MLGLNRNALVGHLGLAYNNEAESLFSNRYSLANYRSLAFLWLNKTYENGLAISFIAVTDGLEDEQGSLHHRLTFGPHLQYNSSRYSLASSFYYQLGENTSDVDLSAFLFSLNNTFNFSKSSVGFGVDYVSGTDGLDQTNKKINTFNTLYATNHKFYGYMDYFLDVPSDTKEGGLIDTYFKMINKLNDKSSFDTHLHYFLLANNVRDPGNLNNSLDNNLGFEIDGVYSHSIHSEVQIQVGLSFMLPAEAMRQLRGGDKGNLNTWAWTMITFRPEFFKTKEDNND